MISEDTKNAILHTVFSVNACKIIPSKIIGVESYIFNNNHIVIVEYNDSKGDFQIGGDMDELKASAVYLCLDTIMKASREIDAPKEFKQVINVDYDFVDMIIKERAINFAIKNLV